MRSNKSVSNITTRVERGVFHCRKDHKVDKI